MPDFETFKQALLSDEAVEAFQRAYDKSLGYKPGRVKHALRAALEVSTDPASKENPDKSYQEQAVVKDPDPSEVVSGEDQPKSLDEKLDESASADASAPGGVEVLSLVEAKRATPHCDPGTIYRIYDVGLALCRRGPDRSDSEGEASKSDPAAVPSSAVDPEHPDAPIVDGDDEEQWPAVTPEAEPETDQEDSAPLRPEAEPWSAEKEVVAVVAWLTEYGWDVGEGDKAVSQQVAFVLSEFQEHLNGHRGKDDAYRDEILKSLVVDVLKVPGMFSSREAQAEEIVRLARNAFYPPWADSQAERSGASSPGAVTPEAEPEFVVGDEVICTCNWCTKRPDKQMRGRIARVNETSYLLDGAGAMLKHYAASSPGAVTPETPSDIALREGREDRTPDAALRELTVDEAQEAAYGGPCSHLHRMSLENVYSRGLVLCRRRSVK